MIKIKINKFLIFFQNTLLNYPDISINTMRRIIKEFENCLSDKEIERETTFLLLRVINEIGIKQISMKTTIEKINYDKLQAEYNKLKGVDEYENS